VAAWTGDKARYIRNRGLDDQYYRKMITDYIGEYGQANRQDINALLLPKLPDVLSEAQKNHKIRNLMQAMRKEGIIYPEGGRATAIWRLGLARDELFSKD
jgi:ATP-dependent DNA helicase RecG